MLCKGSNANVVFSTKSILPKENQNEFGHRVNKRALLGMLTILLWYIVYLMEILKVELSQRKAH